MGEMICSIICGAPSDTLQTERVEGFVIAADRGLDYCKRYGITPDLIVGDFDSVSSTPPQGVECRSFPTEKDETDSALAAKIALEMGYNELRFFCALGGRQSHTTANIQLAYSLKNRGARPALFGEKTELFLLENESVKIPKFDGYLSIFAYGNSAEISARGVKYPTEKHVFTNDFPLGVSNEITADFAEITAHSGVAVIIKEFN